MNQMTTEALTSVGHRPGSKWSFDTAVAGCFSDMLARSIPDYQTMRKLVLDLGSRFVQQQTDIIDLGSSRGDGLAPFIDRFGAGNRYVALDESQPMVDACRERFPGWIGNGLLDVRLHDLRDGLPPLFPSLTLAVLTLQFTPIECRQRIIADAYRITRPGGAMIVVEKILGPDAAADRVLVDNYYRMKSDNGYSRDDIETKRRALQGVLVPLTAEGNVAMLRAEGFRVSQFWQALNFAGWLAVKPKGED
jgi:tRNA (cmo5U34)-methyltransferase